MRYFEWRRVALQTLWTGLTAGGLFRRPVHIIDFFTLPIHSRVVGGSLVAF